MGIPEKSAFVVLTIVVTSIIACALFVCREVPNLEESLLPKTPAAPSFPAVVPAVIIEEDAATTQAPPSVQDESGIPATQRWYRRHGLAPRWMMRNRETHLEHARGAHVGRDHPAPELRVDLLADPLRPEDPIAPEANGSDDADVR